ncbi:MAG: hypothetical protein ACE5H4_02205 [Candidatus Thorarchaeota archaeon]
MASTDSKVSESLAHWLPLAIMDSSPNFKVEGRKRLQKLVFLGEVEGHLGEHFRFERCHYGPYSSTLQETLDHLKIQGYVKESKTEIDGLSPRRDYTMTALGRNRVKELEDKHSLSKLRERLTKALEKFLEMPISGILDHVYGNYTPPEFYEMEILNEKSSTLEKSLKRYSSFWGALEEEHYPLSVFILAIYDQIAFALDSLQDLEPLDAHIVCGAAFDLIGASKDLLHQVEMYGCGSEEERPSGVQAALEEIRDIMTYFESFNESRGVLVRLDDVVISDHTTNRERKALRRRMKKKLQKLL